MNPELKGQLKDYFKEEFAEVILEKLKNGHSLSSFKINPFVLIALSSGVFGDPIASNMAKALIYPRVFGTSISTTFGDSMQKMCIQFLGASASSTPGMDIEFVDKVDGGRVILQLKSGPNNINSGDVQPILDDMSSAYRLLRQNRANDMPIFAIGIVYGVIGEISSHYKKLRSSSVGGQPNIPILIGQDFWHRLNGNPTFYSEMISIFIEVFEEEDYSALLQEDIERLTLEIEEKYFTDGEFDPAKI
jgi:type II restriction endonuclease EcoO109I-like protein